MKSKKNVLKPIKISNTNDINLISARYTVF